METIAQDELRTMVGRWDEVFTVLSAEPRRQIVAALVEAPPDRQLSLPEAANPSFIRTDTEELSVELLHTHLPMLEECGTVEWERTPFSVSRGPRFREAAAVIESLQEHADAIPDDLTTGCQRLEEELLENE